MKLLLICLLLTGCATVAEKDRGSAHPYEEATECPADMDRDQYASGVVRCQAMCGSHNRGFEAFDRQCRCICAPAAQVPTTEA